MRAPSLFMLKMKKHLKMFNSYFGTELIQNVCFVIVSDWHGGQFCVDSSRAQCIILLLYYYYFFFFALFHIFCCVVTECK